MLKYMYVALGGALGSVIRFAFSGLNFHPVAGKFPLGTLVVNLTGSFLIGFLGGIFEGHDAHSAVKLFLLVGILGGFTTFSSFSLENMNLFRSGHHSLAIIYVLVTNIAGLGLAFGGFFAARLLTGVK